MKSHRPRSLPSKPASRTGLARALSKLGFCSRSEAFALCRADRVRLNGTLCRDPERPVVLGRDAIEVDGQEVRAEPKVYLMLNKPRGLITTASDEQGRDTVFACFADAGPRLPRVFPAGRLDKASEGLLLFSNDTQWAAAITDPESRLCKVYHVQLNRRADEAFLRRMESGTEAGGELLAAKEARLLRTGEKNCWLEVVLDEGKNRHIRRLMEALGAEVLRLIRVEIGGLPLGTLPKGSWRHLTQAEVQLIAPRGAAGPGRKARK